MLPYTLNIIYQDKIISHLMRDIMTQSEMRVLTRHDFIHTHTHTQTHTHTHTHLY